MTGPTELARAVLELEVVEAELELARLEHAHGRRSRLAATVAAAEADVARLAGAPFRRELLPHELEARVAFAELETELDELTERLSRQLIDDRQRYLELSEPLMRSHERGVELGYMMLDPAGPYMSPTGELERVLADRLEHYERELQGGYRAGWQRMVDEARDQGVPVPRFGPDLDHPDALDTLRQVNAGARPLAHGAYLDLMQRLEEHYYAHVLVATPLDDVVDELLETGRNLSERRLEDRARQAANRTTDLGRTDASKVLPQAARWYASELLDRNTCGPCSLIDGREYPSEAASLVDYPAGRYRDCEGGVRCRGTRIIVWDEEAEPTLRNPGDTPPPTPPPGGYPSPPGPSTPPLTIPLPPTPPRPAWAAELDDALAALPDDRTLVGLRPDGEVDATALGDSRGTYVPGDTVLEHEAAVRRAGAIVEARAREVAAERIAELPSLAELSRIRDRANEAGRRASARAVEVRNAVVAELRDADPALADDLLEAIRRSKDDPRVRRADEDRDAALDAAREADRRAGERAAVEREVLADARLEALAELRPMGGAGRLTIEDSLGNLRGNAAGRQVVEEAAQRYPTSWLDTSNRAGPVVPEAVGQRAFHRSVRTADGRHGSYLSVPDPTTDPRFALQTAIHELGHRMEATHAALGRLQWAFHRRRSAGSSGDPRKPARIRRLSTVKPRNGYRADELTREDRYHDAYTGKEYRGQDAAVARGRGAHFEVFTTGVESVLSRGRYADGDPELVELILGILASL